MSSIFISHSHKDKAFVTRLVKDLRESGYFVWFDEAEIQVGDSLIGKIREGIDRVEFVGVVLSKDSINSEWVKKEVDIAMNQEIENKRVKVIPILKDKVELPGFLKGKKYADFTSDSKYCNALIEIKRRLNEIPSSKINISSQNATELREKLEVIRKELELTKNGKELLLKKLSLERKSINPDLKKTINKEAKDHPEFKDINQIFAFMIDDTPITANYLMWCAEKEMRKGMPHPIILYAEMENKMGELSLLTEAMRRRLKEIESI